MAAYSHSRVGSRASLAVGEPELPDGSCNYRDLSIGSRAPVCGCARFWLNVGNFTAQDGGSERAWCFCGHHACFHGSVSQQQPAQEQSVIGARARGVQEAENGNGNNTYAGDIGLLQPAPATPQKRPTGLGIQQDSRMQSQSINTRVWQALNDFARNQEDGGGSDLPSTNAPSLVEESRLSPNRIIQERLHHYRSMAPPINIPPGPTPRPPEEYSATEVATPSIAGTPDFRAIASSSTQTRISPGHLQPGRIETRHALAEETAPPEPIVRPATAPQPQPARGTLQGMSAQELQSVLRVYGQRIEVLESLSFSQVPVEELQERFELFDGRILDLEQWRTDHEQNYVSDEPARLSSSKRRRLLPTEGSFGSDASFDSNAAAHAEATLLATLAVNAETHPRIDALENRVSDLEGAALPSFARPWQVQVVLLPWGRDLRGIWFSSTEATQHSMRSTTQQSEEWTGAQSAPKLSFKSANSGAWTTESIQAWAKDAQEWLSPKACGPSGTVFQRLASRGLIRDVTLTAGDSRHIIDAICRAFANILQSDTEIGAEETSRYQALNEPFIPLRKVRKSSRLRFLSAAEMITSATWTASFLDSNVFMKVTDGQRRLYMTTPDAYAQPSGDACSWRKIRELPLVDASGEEQLAQNEHLAIEACWTYNEQLDYVPSVHSSFGSHESQWSTRSQIALNDAEGSEHPPASPRSESHLLRQRTVSLPSSSSAIGRLRETLPKRRVASFEPVATIPIHADESGVEIVAKRRRISLSPEAERRGVNFTPRLSREPPSPFTSEAAAEGRSQGTSSRKRGNTPFAYATPHSNNHFISRLDLMIGDGDTEADTELYADKSERGEEEWEGVEEGDTNRSDHGSVVHDKEHEVDDDELDVEGMELYAP